MRTACEVCHLVVFLMPRILKAMLIVLVCIVCHHARRCCNAVTRLDAGREREKDASPELPAHLSRCLLKLGRAGTTQHGREVAGDNQRWEVSREKQARPTFSSFKVWSSTSSRVVSNQQRMVPSPLPK
ncbi:hypothetical protein B0T17DRAFT_246843 [Bombardia bombarda]|uniref:Uncharacterized protein n=1 Tax=Bombardia bombarda TaxID=252184 RepID=A0AA40C521_9PEZI|nr:hypothetical protein B0T17DRAFT_246843 [Bombardia bombarda]